MSIEKVFFLKRLFVFYKLIKRVKILLINQDLPISNQRINNFFEFY